MFFIEILKFRIALGSELEIGIVDELETGIVAELGPELVAELRGNNINPPFIFMYNASFLYSTSYPL